MSGDLKWNKIFGAGLATALVIIGVQQVTSALYASEPPEKMGYFIDAPEEAGAGAEVELLPDWGTVLPTADLAAGEAAFARCQACHNIAQGGANGIGPNLWGVVGGPVMHMGNFAYSDAFSAHKAEEPMWTYDELDAFITAPQRHISGTKMSFAGIRDTETRINLIAYLRSQGSTGYPIPAPDPSRQPGAAPAEAVPGAEAEGAAVEAGTPTTGTGPQAPVAGPGAAPTIEESVAPPASDSAPRGG